MITVRRQDYETAVLPLPPADEHDLVVRLRPSRPRTVAMATGTVLLPDGSPALGARVVLDMVGTHTNGDGAFSVEIARDLDDTTPLVASLAGHRPAIRTDFGALVSASSPSVPPPVTLVLGPTPLSIGGIVVDADGGPLAGWTVDLLDGTPVSPGRFPPTFVESLERGRVPFVTDESGAFRIDGLLDRSYVLRAYDGKTLASVKSAPIRAGTVDAVMRLATDPLHPRVAGRILSREGIPVAGATVIPGLVTHRPEGPSYYMHPGHLRLVVTDGRGTFELEGVPRRGAFLAVSGDRVMPDSRELLEHDDVLNLELRVALRVHFRVTVSGWTEEEPLQIELVDGAGQRISIDRFQAGGWGSSSREKLDELGRTGILSVSEDARELRVLSGGVILYREDVTLLPEIEVNEITVTLP